MAGQREVDVKIVEYEKNPRKKVKRYKKGHEKAIVDQQKMNRLEIDLTSFTDLYKIINEKFYNLSLT